MTGRVTAGVLCGALLVAGCTLGPDWETPEVEVPEQYLRDPDEGASVANLPWWEIFDDEELRRLIEIALDENRELAASMARIAEARATLGFVQTDQLPGVGYSGRASRADPGEEALFAPPIIGNDFGIGLDVFFEVDLWGRYRRGTEAARAEMLATEASFISVTISLIAEVASQYLLLLDLDARLEISERTLETRREATKINRDRYREGMVADIDVRQAEIEEATAEVGVYSIQRQIARAEHALSVLIGRNPGRIQRSKGLGGKMEIHVPPGLPSELLRRRPDIAVAENQAAAQTARIGVAEALRFPQLSLTGAFGQQSEDIDDLFNATANFWSIGGSFTGPIFEFGRNIRRVEVEEARARQAVLGYEQAVLRAFAEVEDALIDLRTYQSEFEARTRQVASAKEAARLTRALYDEQFTSYLDVLVQERSLFTAELEQSQALRSRLQAIVRLYKALGGGWTPPVEEEAGDADDEDASGEGDADDGDRD